MDWSSRNCHRSVTVYAGLEVAYLGFGGLTTIIGISMIIYLIWVGNLGGLMCEKINVKEDLEGLCFTQMKGSRGCSDES